MTPIRDVVQIDDRSLARRTAARRPLAMPGAAPTPSDATPDSPAGAG